MEKHLIQLRSEDIDPSGLIKVSRAARLLDVGESTIYEWIASGKLPAYRLERTVRLRAEEFIRWVDLYFKPTRRRVN